MSPVAQELEVVAEAIPYVAWMSAPDGSTDYVNTRGAEYTGRPRQDAYGWGWVAFVHDDDASRTEQGWREATSRATPFEMTYRLRRGDGEFRWFTGRALPIRDDDGTILRWLGTAVDVDDAVRLGNRLRTIESQTSELLDQLHSTSDDIDLEPVERTVRAIRVNALVPDPPATPTTVRADNGLTARELDVVRLIARGYTNREAANQLSVSLRTVESDRSNAMRKLGVGSRAALVRSALDAGIIEWH